MNQTEKILSKLQMGPVCGTTFLQMFIPRYAARIHELRRAGHQIQSERCQLHDHETHQVVYRLDTESQLSLLGEGTK